MTAPPMLTLAGLSPDVRARLAERVEAWQADLPWYRRAPAPTEEAPLYLALERIIRELAAERDRAVDMRRKAERALSEKQSELIRFLWRILLRATESRVKLPTDAEEAAGRTLDVFVGEIARGYRRARLALFMLQTERETRRPAENRP